MANPFANDIENAEIGRFSSTLLGQSGARKRVRNVGGAYTTTYDLRKGTEAFPPASAIALSGSALEPGALHENTYTAVLGYFLSRGVTKSNASTMATLIMDVSKLNNTSAIGLLESLPVMGGKTALDPTAYESLNLLRGTGEQQEVISTINNSKSLKSRSIKA